MLKVNERINMPHLFEASGNKCSVCLSEEGEFLLIDNFT